MAVIIIKTTNEYINKQKKILDVCNYKFVHF